MASMLLVGHQFKPLRRTWQADAPTWPYEQLLTEKTLIYEKKKKIRFYVLRITTTCI